MGIESFNLVLEEVQAWIPQENFAYLVTTVSKCILEFEGSDKRFGSSGGSESFMADIKERFDPLAAREIGSISQEHINLSSLKGSQRDAQGNDVSCSHLPLCRKIISKIALKLPTIGSASSISKMMMERRKSEVISKSLTPLIGKISYPVESKRKKKGKEGVVDLSYSISNPLYKEYKEEGFVKDEDVAAKEFIVTLAFRFNSWLASLGGNPVELSPQTLIRILREDLDVPEPSELTNIERLYQI